VVEEADGGVFFEGGGEGRLRIGALLQAAREDVADGDVEPGLDLGAASAGRGAGLLAELELVEGLLEVAGDVVGGEDALDEGLDLLVVGAGRVGVADAAMPRQREEGEEQRPGEDPSAHAPRTISWSGRGSRFLV